MNAFELVKEYEYERRFYFLSRKPYSRVLEHMSTYDLGAITTHLEDMQYAIPMEQFEELEALSKPDAVLPESDKILADWYEGAKNYRVVQHLYYFERT